MALVVTARSLLDSPSSLADAAVVATPRGRRLLVGRLAGGSALAVAASLSGDTALRALPALANVQTGSVSLATLLGGLHLVGLGLIVATCVAAWATLRQSASALLFATLAAVLAGLHVVLTGIFNGLDLALVADVVLLAIALLLLGALTGVATACLWMTADRSGLEDTPRAVLVRNVVDVTAFVVFALALSGAAVRAIGAGWACGQSFPDCAGYGILPFGRDPLADVQLYHRALAYAGALLVAWIAVESWRTLRSRPAVGRSALALVAATAAQTVIGITSVASLNPALTQTLHTFGAAVTFGTAVAMSVAMRRAPMRVAAVTDAPGAAHTWGRLAHVVAAYVQLTKPRVMSLLLATTAAAMVVAARGMPDVGTLIATLIGGALMSGGAGAINHYVDRDIDPLMGRTAWRPIPSGVISPTRALGFGVLLGALASVVFLVFVNPVAWVLALLGLLGYVFIYTLWLKRSTPSNIVIGGAAGAIPPLVGWAAVTHEISSLTAWYLFAIIFFWTPPHFWALSLLIRQHYERAGVPMLPVVRGEDETRRQIVLYSALLVALTLVLSPFGLMGLPYFVTAVVLGGLFLRGAVRLWRHPSREAARSLYLFSLLYLFALFTAMAVDRVVTA